MGAGRRPGPPRGRHAKPSIRRRAAHRPEPRGAGLASCTEVPAAFADSAGRTVIDGTAFTTFDGRDAAMSHHLATKNYRTVHDGACYAIDVIVTGTQSRSLRSAGDPTLHAGRSLRCAHTRDGRFPLPAKGRPEG